MKQKKIKETTHSRNVCFFHESSKRVVQLPAISIRIVC